MHFLLQFIKTSGYILMNSEPPESNHESIKQETNQQTESLKCEELKEKYGSNFQPHLLEQYKMYIEMMDRVTERRGKINAFYISLLSSLLALLSLLIDKNIFYGSKNALVLILAILGLALCYIWYINIDSYKQLNYLKFRVIHEIEPCLPFPFYSKEWKIEKNKVGQYRRLSKVEKSIPIIIAIPYLGLLIYSICSLFVYIIKTKIGC